MRLALVLALVLCLAPAAAAAPPPEIAAPEAIALEATTGDVIFEKDADTRRPMASTTKLMTALIVLEQADLKDVVTAPRYDGLSVETVMRLVPGEKITVHDLLRGLLLVSANDAAFTLAKHVGGSVPSFVRMMNRRAQQLGLQNTSYANPIGLDDAANYSTARDLATLTVELRKSRVFRRIVNATDLATRSGNPRTLANRNALVTEYGWVNGVKTGTTLDAGYVLVASGNKNDVPIVSVVMGATDEAARDDQSVALLNYGFSKFKFKRLTVENDRSKGMIPIRHRAGAELPVVYGATVRQVLRKKADTKVEVSLPAEVEGPVDYHEPVGEAVVSVDGETVATVPLLAALEVPATGFGRRVQNVLTQPWSLVALGVVLLLATLLTQRRRPAQRRRTRGETAA
ncbi:MAG: D-alanyl-D-alanine carboxypeptidase family protein [Solirubrobacteraceae bacterium]